MEELAKEYYNKIYTSNNKSAVLTDFFCNLFSLTKDASYYVMFSKLVKLYGVEAVFNAIIDVYGMDNLNLQTNLYPLFNTICKRYVLQTVDILPNLKDEISKIKTKKKKPTNIGDPFGD